MGLSNSIRELLLENIERNNYVNDLKPVSKQIEFSTVEELHHKTIEESKKVKVKKTKDKTKEFKIDKIESSQKEEEEEEEEEEAKETAWITSHSKTTNAGEVRGLSQTVPETIKRDD